MLSRLVFLPLLIAATLPCPAQQSAVAKQSPPPLTFWQAPKSAPPTIFLSPSIKVPGFAVARKLEPSLPQGGMCYAIRDYQFEYEPGSSLPTQEKYTTCESASLFHLDEVKDSQRPNTP